MFALISEWKTLGKLEESDFHFIKYQFALPITISDALCTDFVQLGTLLCSLYLCIQFLCC